MTNVTHEHLEFHGTWEAYRDAKLSLFERLGERAAEPAQDAGRPRLAQGRRSSTVTTPSAALFEAVTREAGARVLTYGTDAGC